MIVATAYLRQVLRNLGFAHIGPVPDTQYAILKAPKPSLTTVLRRAAVSPMQTIVSGCYWASECRERSFKPRDGVRPHFFHN